MEASEIVQVSFFDCRVCGESKLAKMACSGSLAPCFVNNDYGTGTAEIAYSTAPTPQEVLTWSRATVCSLYELHHENPGSCCTGLHWSGIMIVLCMVMLYYVMSASTPAEPARRE